MFQLPPNISGFELLDTNQIRHIYACHYESNCCKDLPKTKFNREKYDDEYNDGYLSTFEPFDIKGSCANPAFSGGWKKHSPPFLLFNEGSGSGPSGEIYSLSDRPAGPDIFTTGYEEKIIGKISGWWKDVASYNGEVNAAIDSSGHLYMWGPFSSYNGKDQFQNWARYLGLDEEEEYVQRPKFERVEHKTLYGILDCSISGISSKSYNTSKYTSFKISDKNFDVDSISFIRPYCGDEPIGTGCLINPRYRYYLTNSSLGGNPIPGSGCEHIKFRTVPGSSIQTVSEARYIVDLDYRLTNINVLSSGNNYTFLNINFTSKDNAAILPSGDCELQDGRLKSISATPGNGRYIPSYELVGDGIGAKILLEWEAHPIRLRVLNKGHYFGMDPVKENNSKFLLPWEINRKEILDIVYGSPNDSQSLLYANGRNYTGIYASVTGWDVIESGSSYTSRFDSRLICSNNLGKYVAYLHPGTVKCLSDGCDCDNISPSIKNFNNDNLNHTIQVYGQLYGPIEGATATEPPSGWKDNITDGEITGWFVNWGYTPEPSLPPPWSFSMTVENGTYINLPLKSWSAEHPIVGSPTSSSGTCSNNFLLAAYVEPTVETPELNITYSSEHYAHRNTYSIPQGIINRKVSRLEYDYELNNVTFADPDKLLYETEPFIKQDNLILVRRTQTWEQCADTTRQSRAFCQTSFKGGLVPCFPPPSGSHLLKNSIIVKKPELYTDVYYRLFEQFSEDNEFKIQAGVGYELGEDSGIYDVDISGYALDNLGDRISHIYFSLSTESGVSGIKGLTFEPEIHVYNYPIMPLKVDDGKIWEKIEVGMNTYDPDRASYAKSYNWLPVAIDTGNKPWILTDYLITPLINREIYSEHVPYYTGILPYILNPYYFTQNRMHCYKDGSAPETSNVGVDFYGKGVDWICHQSWPEDKKFDPFDCVDDPDKSWFPGWLPLGGGVTFICGCFYPDSAGVKPHPAYEAYWKRVGDINISQYPSIFFSRILGVVGGLSQPDYKVINNVAETIPTIKHFYTTNAHFQWQRFDNTLAYQDFVPVILEGDDGEIYQTRPPHDSTGAAAQFPFATPSRPLNLADHRARKHVSIRRFVPCSLTDGFTGDQDGAATFSIIPNPNLVSNGWDAVLDPVGGDVAVQYVGNDSCHNYSGFTGRWPRGRISVGPPSNQIITGYTGGKSNICLSDGAFGYSWRRTADHGVHTRRFGCVLELADSYPEYDGNFSYEALDELLDFDYYIPQSRFLPVPKFQSAEFNYSKLAELWGSGTSHFTCRDYIFDGNIMGGFFPSFWFPWAPPLLPAIIILKDVEQLPLKSSYQMQSSFNGSGKKLCLDVLIECCSWDFSAFPPERTCSEPEVVKPVSDRLAGRDDVYWSYPAVDNRGNTIAYYRDRGLEIPTHLARYMGFKVPAFGDCNPFAGLYPPPGVEIDNFTPNCYMKYPGWGPEGVTYPDTAGFQPMIHNYWNGNYILAGGSISFGDRENYSIWYQKTPAPETIFTQDIISIFSSQWGSFCSYSIPSGQGENYYDTINLKDFKGNDKFKPLAVVPFKLDSGDSLLYLKDHGPIDFEIWRLFEGISRIEYNKLILENRVGDRRWQKYAIPWITGTATIEWHEQGGHNGSLHRFNMDFWLQGTDRDINRSKSNQFNPLLYIDKQNELRNSLFYWSEPQDRISIYRHGSGEKLGGKIEDSMITMYDSGNNPYFSARVPAIWQTPNYFVNYRVSPSSLAGSGNSYWESSGIYVSGLPDNGIGPMSMPGIPVIKSSGIPTMLETVDLKYTAKVNQIILENSGLQYYTKKPLVYIDPPNTPDGIVAKAECEIEGPLKPILVDSGDDYDSVPYLDFIGSGIPPVIDELSIESGKITSIICTMDGLYRENPNIIIVGGGGENASITGIFTGYPIYINVTDSGSGYEYPPNVYIESQGYSGTILNELSIPEYELLPTTTRAQAAITGCLLGSGIPADCVIFNKWSGADPTDSSLGYLYYDAKWGGNLIFHDNISEYTTITELTGILKLDDWYYGPKNDRGFYENPLDALKIYVHDCNEGLRISGVNQIREIPEDPDRQEFTPFPSYNSTSIPIKPSIIIEDGGVLFTPSRLKRLRIVGEVGPNSRVKTPESSNKSISVSQLFSKQMQINSNVISLQNKFTLKNVKWSNWPDIRIYDVSGSGAIISGSLDSSGIINSIYFTNQGNRRYTQKSTLHFVNGSTLFVPAIISGTLDTLTSGVKSITIKNSGIGYYPYPYDNYNISIEHNTGSGLEISAKIPQGPVPSGLSAITIINPGSGYSFFPKITIQNNDLHYPQKLLGAINLSLHTNPYATFQNISDFPLDYIPNPYRDKPKYLIDETKFNMSKYYYRHNGIADVSIIHGHKGMNKFYNTNSGLPTLDIVYPSGYHQLLSVEHIKYPIGSGSGFLSSDKFLPALGSNFNIYRY